MGGVDRVCCHSLARRLAVLLSYTPAICHDPRRSQTRQRPRPVRGLCAFRAPLYGISTRAFRMCFINLRNLQPAESGLDSSPVPASCAPRPGLCARVIRPRQLLRVPLLIRSLDGDRANSWPVHRAGPAWRFPRPPSPSHGLARGAAAPRTNVAGRAGFPPGHLCHRMACPCGHKRRS